MSYIDLIRKFWQLDATWQFGCCESRLYFYLVEQANRLGWPDNFTHSDRRLSENVGASRNAISRAKTDWSKQVCCVLQRVDAERGTAQFFIR